MARVRADIPSAAAIAALVDAGNCLAIRATPNARADAIALPAPNGRPALTVRVTAAPEDGRANDAILTLLAKALGRPRSALTLVRGASGRDKIVRVAPG
jgi:uncharacterized protein